MSTLVLGLWIVGDTARGRRRRRAAWHGAWYDVFVVKTSVRARAWIVAIAVSACGPEDPADDTAGVDLAISGSAGTSLESAIVASPMEAAAAVPSPLAPGAPAEAARRAAALAAGAWAPAGCASARLSGDRVTYTLARCRAPQGAGELSGAIDVTFSRGRVLPNVVARASALRVGGSVVDFAITADFEFDRAGAFVLTMTSTTTGVTPRGLPIDRRAQHTLRWERERQCATLDGRWSGEGATATTTALRRCGGRCPEPGGEVRLERPALGEVVTLSFPGGSAGLWRRAVGGVARGAGTFPLDCAN